MYVIVNLICLGYGLLIGKKKTFVDIILDSDKIKLSIVRDILLKNRLIMKIMVSFNQFMLIQLIHAIQYITQRCDYRS